MLFLFPFDPPQSSVTALFRITTCEFKYMQLFQLSIIILISETCFLLVKKDELTVDIAINPAQSLFFLFFFFSEVNLTKHYACLKKRDSYNSFNLFFLKIQSSK